ncbi:hypothetical protein QEH59_09075 [Coraliomargarita sp. SDUM461004]|uniref:Uncharacterized protein n=1 Tax=Thalassobacterium sedimentorum TaxID=3041258 RepID=A0ABU1AID9_9BACT|nr:hypothetical protein [Coraliomargarita sp. SDUM461004]MDQ8194576.1 hypothetical protein [Coraliomargarita sp. SDUM461004]
MEYSVTFKHIDRNFGFDQLDSGNWSEEFEDEASFARALHKMALASSQHTVIDFPEVEIHSKHGRVTVRAINGQLYFTDFHSQNRKDLKVVPLEVIRLLGGTPIDELTVPEESVEAEAERPKLKPYRSHGSRVVQVLSLLFMLCVFCLFTTLIWRDMVHQQRLYPIPEFVPSLSQESYVVRKYADVYVSEYREGAMLFSLTRDGVFSRYEMWNSTAGEGYELIHIDTYSLQVGEHEGTLAMLADEHYLLQPEGDEMIRLHGVAYHRHHGTLESIGEVVNAQD